MSQLKIGRIARAAIVSRIANSTTGFAPLLTASFSDAGIAPPIGFSLPINFATYSKNFFQANLNPGMLAQSTAYTFPVMTLFSMHSRNANLEKFATFAGPIELGLNFFASWKATSGLTDMETPGDCYEEAIIGTFNAPAIADWSQRFDGRLVYNGDISIQRSPIEMDGENWQQAFLGVIGLDVHAL